MMQADRNATAQGGSAYKSSEKHWRQLRPQAVTCDTALLDVRNLSATQQQSVRQIGRWTCADGSTRPVLSFAAFGPEHEGFLVIPNAIDLLEQLALAHSCLTEFTEPPHVTNMGQPLTDLWRDACKANPKDPAKVAPFSKLSWAAAGFQYEWTQRKYFRHRFSPVPPVLAQLATRAASACGLSIQAEAVIVNFYKKSSTMGGHQDDVEYTMDHPVVSLSLGSRSVFLKGGLSKDVAPLPVLLRSGDLAILSGSSRLSYHGVARVLPTPLPLETEDAWLELCKQLTTADDQEEQDDWDALRRYLETHRININVRQVFPIDPLPLS